MENLHIILPSAGIETKLRGVEGQSVITHVIMDLYALYYVSVILGW